jgi:Tfp pilus assembly protein PilX/lipopolysaccharide export system protein LptA
MQLIRARLAGEQAIALPTAVIILFIITILTGTAIAVAVQTSTSTRRDDSRKAALEAAEAGLRVARFRLTSMGREESNECVGSGEPHGGKSTEAPTVAGTYCVSPSENIGNKTSYKYWTSTALGSSSYCAGSTVTNASDSVAQRCIMAVGTAGAGTTSEVTRRLEERVATFTAAPLFDVKGLTGLENITLKGNDHVISSLGSNGAIGGNGSVSGSGEVVLGPSGTDPLPSGFVVTKTTTESTPLVLSPVNPGNSATVNNNEYITNGFDASSGNVKYEASKRELELGGNATLNLHDGTYNFCKLKAAANSTLAVAPGATVKIFIDSPEDPTSGCPAGSGEFSFKGGLTTPSGNPTALQIYVYGKGPVTYDGNVNAAATIYAPQAEVELGGNATLAGGVAAKAITVNGNFSFSWDERDAALQAEPAVMYYRTAWEECTPTVTASAVQTGC